MDQELNAAIDRHMEAAVDIHPRTVNITKLARSLNADFPHRSVEEILERIKGAWRTRGMFWDE